MSHRLALPLLLLLTLLLGACAKGASDSSPPPPADTKQPDTWNNLSWNQNDWS